MLKDNYDEELAEYVLSQLVEKDDQIISYFSNDYFFEEFYYDGVLVTKMTEKFAQVFIPKWCLQHIKIIK